MSTAAALDLLAALPQPSADEVRAARTRAGLTLAQCAQLAGLGAHARWAEYESGTRQIDRARWSLFLLATGQHPRAAARPR